MADLLPDEIRTARLWLRRPGPDDAGGIFRAYAQDPLVCRFMAWTPHETEAETRAFIESCIRGWDGGALLPYVITRTAAADPIGMLEARILDAATVDIGYVLARAEWGSGLMPEAVRALADAAFARTPVTRLQATCDVENVASWRVLEKAGFLREACLPRHAVHPNVSPEPRDCYLYGRCRPA